MNPIAFEQNSQKQLERLAAQRELYSSAKRLHIVQILATVLLPVGLAIASLINRELSLFGAIYGLFIFLFDIALIEPAIKRKKAKAAKIQELFDCDVLQLPKSPLKTVDDITVEEVLRHYNAHAKIQPNIEKIKDWYPVKISDLPLSIARLICQRSNCWWDSKLRERYATFLQTAGITVLSFIVVIALLSGYSVTMLTLIAAGLVPFFRFCIRNCNDNRDAAQRLNELVSYAQKVWNDALAGKLTEENLEVNSRRLQDEIFEHRRRSPLILDVYYKLFREKDEDIMNVGAAKMIEDYKKK